MIVRSITVQANDYTSTQQCISYRVPYNPTWVDTRKSTRRLLIGSLHRQQRIQEKRTNFV